MGEYLENTFPLLLTSPGKKCYYSPRIKGRGIPLSPPLRRDEGILSRELLWKRRFSPEKRVSLSSSPLRIPETAMREVLGIAESSTYRRQWEKEPKPEHRRKDRMTHEEEESARLSTSALVRKLLVLVVVSGGVGILGGMTVLEAHQATAVGVFLGIILGTLFFWNFRLAIAFLGLSVLICSNSLDIPHFVQSSALEVILFLVGMMIVVGALRDLGFFTWIVQLIVSMPNISGKKFIAVTAVASALLACAVDEVTSTIFIATLIFQVCDRLKLNPVPYILICVLCTNIGSSGTMMGNPVGIYIGTKGGLTFGDFMIYAFPVMLVALLGTAVLTIWFYRRELARFDESLKERLARNLSLAPVVEVPYKQGLTLLLVTICAIAAHHQIENLLGIGKNSVLLIAPLICAGVVMILRRDRARHYVEREVDWWTLLFFMLLFAIAGTLEHTHVDRLMAEYFTGVCGTSHAVLVPFILFVSALGSAFVDNVIFVAAFSPVIEQLSASVKDLPLWWALLFGACFGGNITMIGSTANIVALGMLEKRSHVHVGFFQWFRIGAPAALLAGGIAWGLLTLMTPLMPDREAALKAEHLDGSRSFEGKNACIQGVVSSSSLLYLKEDFPAERFAAFELLPDGAEKTVILYVDRDSPMMAEFASLPILSKRLFHGKVYSEDAMIMMVLESMDSSSSSSGPLKTSAAKTSASVMRSERNASEATSAAGTAAVFPRSSPHSSPGGVVPVPSSSVSAGGGEGSSASAATVRQMPAS